MSDHTPKELRTDVHTVDELRAGFQAANATCCDQCRTSAADRFDRAITKVRAEAKQEALREAADKFQTGDWHGVLQGGAVSRIANGQAVTDWLRARADKLTTL